MKYNNRDNFSHLNVRESVQSIRSFAFYLANISSISLPTSVVVIQKFAFGCCVNLERFNIPKNSQLKEIGFQSFTLCLKLERIHFPRNLELIRENAFCLCGNLKKVVFENKSKVSIAASSFNGTHCNLLLVDLAKSE